MLKAVELVFHKGIDPDTREQIGLRMGALDELTEILERNYEGHEAEYRQILSIPKFGNDDPAADQMLIRASMHIADFTKAQAARAGLDYSSIVNINNYGNVELGKRTGASPDGRKRGEPLANGNTPTAGRDRCGITALLNSMASVPAHNHAGYSHNIKFSRALFGESREKVKLLLYTYFRKGGTQAMINVVNREDLENALREPEKYSNLIVRVGGFSARYVELERAIQMDILNRTLYA